MPVSSWCGGLTVPPVAQAAAMELVDMAVAGGSEDNVCALVVRLPPLLQEAH